MKINLSTRLIEAVLQILCCWWRLSNCSHWVLFPGSGRSSADLQYKVLWLYGKAKCWLLCCCHCSTTWSKPINQSWLSAHTRPNSHVKDTNSCVKASMHPITSPQTNHAAVHPGLENPSWNLEFWSWILSSDVPTNATCRSTQREHAFWASISSYPALTALKLVPAAVSWAIKPLVPLKALLSGANTVTFPRMVLFRSFVNPASPTTVPSRLSCGVAATASNKVVLQVLCMQQVDSIWFQVMIKLS